MQPQQNKNQHGNVMFFILITIVLLAALSFSVTKSSRQTAGVSKENARVIANQILSFTSAVENGVNTMMAQGILESDLCFFTGNNNAIYNAASCATARNVVFSVSGMKYQAPPATANDGSEWYFTGDVAIRFLGSASPELAMLLQDVDQEVCYAINAILGNGFTGGIPDGLATFDAATRFAGTYTANEAINLTAETDGLSAFCFRETGTGNYLFIRALAAR